MSEIVNPGRERILARIDKALEKPRPKLDPPQTSAAFAPVGNLLERFVLECKGNLTDCFVTSDAASTLNELLRSVPEGHIFAEDVPHFRQLLQNCEREIRWSIDGPPAESAIVTITRCESLMARTGSVLVSSSCGGRSASVAAPVHIVVAHERQLVEDVEAALIQADEKKLAETNSFLGVITGCSRTGDIEKILVIGAHGPTRLVVIIERA
jgi:L-lactate dehydrogenase complex protein LldG